MAREIEFRGRHIARGTWVYGHLLAPHIIGVVKEVDDKDGRGYRPEIQEFCLVERASVGQQTGLKDKNGVEIYEGDLLDIKLAGGDRGFVPVVFRDGSFMMHIPYWVGDYYHLSDYDSGLYEVIGNIYEHSHLLEGNQ
ncbi:YopX family protein [Rhodococcus rhodochrous]|uniref:YopX family protein n=1 Tax=Rhodococcus rhodochrous TaxID=1829 RepID=UPI0017807952|nr:YopX family protein [Rhodococcus rhodochrous]QOH56232.1 hypothetical protein C6Y44_09850 [Rhodococcus rhodochrous]